MNNRQQRRAARKGDAILIDFGTLQPRDPNYGLPVRRCYVCGANHNLLDVPLCKGLPDLDHVDARGA